MADVFAMFQPAPVVSRVVGRPPSPTPPEHDLSTLRMILALRSNVIAAWPRRAYDEMLLHRRYLGGDAYLVNDPDEARRILQAELGIFERPLGFRRIYLPIFGKGVLLAEGAAWREQRRRIAPAFTVRHVERLIPSFLAVGNRMLGQLKGAARANLSQSFQDAAIDVVGTALFSTSLNAVTARIRAFRTAYFERAVRVSIFDYLARHEGPYILGRGSRGRIGRQGREIVAEILRERRACPLSRERPLDVIDLLLESRDGSEPLSEEALVDEIATLLGTGFDTTARCMFWVVYLLCLHPESQERVRDELRRFPPAQASTLSDIERWPYLAKCILEAMRLYPPLQGTIRVPLMPVEICGRRIRPGSLVAISAWVMHRHRALWERPDEFVPDRFPGDMRAALRMRGFIPFSAGPRTCIGASFAMVEITLILAQLLERYEVTLEEGPPVTPISVVTTVPSVEPIFRLRPVVASQS